MNPSSPRKEPPRKPDWLLSAHSEERCAKRFKLIVDGAVRKLISQAIDSLTAKLLDLRTGGIHVYEITVMGTKMIVVCNTQRRHVITFLQPDRWHKHHKPKRRRQSLFYGPMEEE